MINLIQRSKKYKNVTLISINLSISDEENLSVDLEYTGSEADGEVSSVIRETDSDEDNITLH